MKHFPIALLCGIIWHIMRSTAAGCPSDAFVQCANKEGETCTITSDIKQGYLVYGAVYGDDSLSKWSFIPFTNSQDLDLQIACDNNLGSPVAQQKVCCYIELDTGFDATDYDGLMIEDKRRYWTHYQLMTQRFGKNGQYIYRVINNANGPCYYTFFGGIAPGVLKECSYKYGAELSPPDLNEDDWEVCGTEHNLCTGLSTAALNWIRYGTDQQYYYRLVLSNDGTINCDNVLFQGSPITKVKTCWRAPSSIHFQGIIGQWKSVPNCPGCDANTYTLTTTVETSSTIERTEEWSTSFQESAKATMLFDGGTGEVSMTTTVSNTVTETELTTTTLTTTTTTTRTCAKAYYYQFVTGATQYDGYSHKSFTVYSASTFCSSSWKLPKCPPPYCLYDEHDEALQDCQNCTAQYHLDMIPPLMGSYGDKPSVGVANITLNITDNITVITTGAYYSTLDTETAADDYVLRNLPNSWMCFLISCSFVYYV